MTDALLILVLLALGLGTAACEKPVEKATGTELPEGGGLELAASHVGETEGVWGLDVVSREGTVDLLLATGSEAEGVRFLHQRSLDGGRSWAAPRPVPTFSYDPAPGHRGFDPQIAADGERLVVAWTARGESPWGTGPIGIAVSSDAGESWEAGETPADDGSLDGHGFLDLAVSSAGRFHAVWLDGRDGDGQGLRTASSSDGKSWSPNVTIDDATCECCWNRLLVEPEGLAVIYRDAAPRDLRVAFSSDEGATWRDRGSPGAFGWSFDGCPHVGGSLAAGGVGTALVWTGTKESMGLYVAPAGKVGWEELVRLGGETARHGDLVRSGDRLVAVWDEKLEDGGTLFVSSSEDEGESWSPPRQLSRRPGSSHPRAVVVPSGVFVVWTTEVDGEHTWASGLLDLQPTL